MIDRCFNPACRRKLHYLRDGRVVRLISAVNGKRAVEHFWLCGPCYEEYNFAFPPEGGVVLAAKPRVEQSTEFHFAEVIVAGREMP